MPSEQENDWKQIISASDDTVSGELLKWSGLDDLWFKYELSADYAFFQDVGQQCYTHLWSDREEWDGGAPGMSGYHYVLEIDDEEGLRKELRAVLAELMWRDRRKIQRRLREAREARADTERKRRAVRPRNRRLLATLSAIYDPGYGFETTKFYVEHVPRKAPQYRLWVRENNGYWYRTDIYEPVADDLVDIGIKMLRLCDGYWKKCEYASWSAGEVLTKEDLEKLTDQRTP